MDKRTIIFESHIATGDPNSKKELYNHIEEIKRLIEPLKVNSVTVKTIVEIK